MKEKILNPNIKVCYWCVHCCAAVDPYYDTDRWCRKYDKPTKMYNEACDSFDLIENFEKVTNQSPYIE